jgi:hypothetical protein
MRIGIFDITADVKDSVTTLFVKDDDQRVVQSDRARIQ